MINRPTGRIQDIRAGFVHPLRDLDRRFCRSVLSALAYCSCVTLQAAAKYQKWTECQQDYMIVHYKISTCHANGAEPTYALSKLFDEPQWLLAEAVSRDQSPMLGA